MTFFSVQGMAVDVAMWIALAAAHAWLTAPDRRM